jgi:hypothetical protein
MEKEMASPEQIAANRKNARKSRGPTSAAGKERARANSLKHGMTARVVLLPTENAAEFKRRMIGWFDELRPRTTLQCFHAERAAYSSWQLDRATRAQSARLLFRAKTNAQDVRDRVAQEVAELAHKLLRAPFGRPAAHPYAVGRDGQTNEIGAGVIERSDPPAQLVMQLESTWEGCQWLLARWNELGAILEDGMAWLAAERFRVFRLLGIHPSDAILTREMASLLQACEVIDSSAGSVVSEIWNEMVSAEALPSLHESYQRWIRHKSAPDEATARACLLGIVAQATARLAERSEERAQRDELEAALAPHLLAVDESPMGVLMRRYAQTCENSMCHHRSEVRRIHAENPDPGGLIYYGDYPQPSPGWLAGLDESIDGDDAGDWTDSCDSADQGDWSRSLDESEISEPEPASHNAVALRNEPNSAEAPVANHVTLPRTDGDAVETAVLDERPLLRKERGDDRHPDGRHAGGRDLSPTRIDEVMAAPTSESKALSADRFGVRRDAAHVNAMTGSRRERRRRNKEQRSARARSR